MPDPADLDVVFAAAVALPSPAARAAYLDRACAAAPDLRGRVEALLKAHDRAGVPPESAATGTFGDGSATADPAATAVHHGPSDAAGAVLAGRYKLVEPVGQGGMGTVWMAQQTEPVRRTVAVKLIKAGMDSRQVLARFEAERQALALMDHPNIAKVLDGGLAPDGRPFFVMELVKGVPITDYCDARKLTPRERLELFVPVCQAIQHAHQKGVIHRDIKPGNVLVGLYDDRPVPKVIDFGVAKATGQQLSEHTINTGLGGVVGTPQYMSPEQATLGNPDIDTRSDVYSLGVLLYELLTGSPPFARKELEKKGLLEILRVVREDEPPKPSTKLSTADAVASLSANRGTEPRQLTALLRNELDWIVLKALEKDRSRRYETANGFAADVRRYLAGEPVAAHPPSAGYRLRKFVRRNRPQVLAAGLVLIALMAGMAGTTWGLVEARRQRDAADLARQAETDQRAAAETAAAAEAEQRTRAEAQARRAEAVAGFLTDTLKGAAPAVARGRDTKLLKDMVDAAAGRLDRDGLAADPAAEVGLRATIGEVYRDVADYPAAERHRRRAADLAVAAFGPADPRTGEAEYDHAEALYAVGRYTACLALAEKVRAGCDRRAEAGGDLAARAWSLIGTARQHVAGGWTADAEAAHRAALDIGRRVHPKGHVKLGYLLRQLAGAYYARAAFADAEPLAREAHDTYLAANGRPDRDTVSTACILADCQLARSKYADAEELMRAALPDAEAVYGPAHPTVADVLWRLGSAVAHRGDPQAAGPFHARCLEIRRATYRGPHKDVATALASLARDKMDAGDPSAAEPLFREVVEMRRALFGPDTPAVGSALEGLGGCLRRLNRPDEAEKTLTQALAAFRATLPDPVNYHGVLFELAMVAQGRRDFPRAVDLFGQIVGVYRRQHGPDHISVARALANRGTPRFRGGDKAGAEADFRDALRIARQAGPTHPTAVLCLGQLQYVLEDRGDWAGAEPLARDAVEVQRALVGAAHPEYAAALARLGDNLLSQRQYAAAGVALREALAVREKSLPDDWRTSGTKSMLGGALLGLKKYAEAEPLLVAGYEGMKRQEKAIPPQGVTRIPEALDRLVGLYIAWTKPVETTKWRAERAKYPFVAPPPRPSPN